MASFTVETYQVSISSRSYDSAQPRILVVSPDLSHGIRNRLTLMFETTPQGYRDAGATGFVLNVGGLNYDGLSLYAYMSSSMFDDIHRVLQTESPAYIHFGYKNIPGNESSTTKYLTYITVSTGDELPGEGDRDADTVAVLANEILGGG